MKNKDKIKGGVSDGMSAEDIAKKHGVDIKKINSQIKMGIKIELEHVDDKDLAREIAIDHLFEIPDYYTRLEKMENSAKKDMKTEGKENITEFARRMRELAGLSEGQEKKTLKTVNEGFESFKSYVDRDGDKVYILPIEASSIQELVDIAGEDEELDSLLRSELSSNEGVRVMSGDVYWGSDIFDFLRSSKMNSISESDEDYELEDRKRQYGINPEIDDFETFDFEQEEIEEGENDSELYNLNENQTIILDFLSEDFDMIDSEDSEPFIVHGYYTLGNAGGYEVMISDDGDAAKVRDAYGSDNPKTSDWLEIEYIADEDSEPDEDGDYELNPVIDPNGYNIPLNMVMRV